MIQIKHWLDSNVNLIISARNFFSSTKKISSDLLQNVQHNQIKNYSVKEKSSPLKKHPVEKKKKFPAWNSARGVKFDGLGIEFRRHMFMIDYMF